MHKSIVYGKLEPSEIRLLRIQRPPGRSDGQAGIVCELEPRVLDKNVPSYTALSYVWGSNALTREITVSVGGKSERKSVTENLFVILEQLSKPSSDIGVLGEKLQQPGAQYFWIDGICINQNDKAEKAAQVQMMGQIYRTASMTLMWIGKSTPASSSALRWFRRIAELDEGLFDTRYVEAGRLFELFEESEWNALCDILVGPYFHRRWIIQEAALSKEPWLVCGEEVIEWNVFETGYDRICGKIFNEISKVRSIRATDMETISAISMLRWRLKNEANICLMEMMVRLRRCDSSNARDRIYGFGGLCSVEEASHIPVSYDENAKLEDLFARQVIAHIRSQKTLDILCICQDRIRIERRQETYQDDSGLFIDRDPPDWARMTYLPALPTWVPNWTSPRTSWNLSPDIKAANAGWKALYNASAGLPPEVHNLDEALHTKRLIVKGIHVDTVQYIEQTTPPPHPDQRNPASNFFRFCFMLYQKIHLSETPFRTEADRLDSFWRTITLNGHKPATHHFFTMEMIRHLCLEFFQRPRPEDPFGSLFGKFLSHIGFHRSQLPPPHTWFTTNDDVPPVYFEPNQHGIDFDHFCFFRFFVAASGRMGMGPPWTQPGDQVCVLFGCSSPMLLHQNHVGGTEYLVRGEAYLDGMMNGEAIDLVRSGEIRDQIFGIV